MTLDRIVHRNAARFPEKAALIADGRTMTWSQLNARVDAAAGALAAAGVDAGDRVAILMGNCPEYFELYFACSRMGAIAVPLNYRLTAGEAGKILGHAEPSLVVCDTKHRAAAAATLRTLERSLTVWCVEDPSEAGAMGADAMTLPVVPYLQALSSASQNTLVYHGSDRDTFAIFYTSGTTGLPKGAMVSHLNLEMNGYSQMFADASRADDVNLVSTPVYYMGAIFMAVTYMMLGCTQVILPQFSPASWLATLQQTRATVSLLIPTMINAVLGAPELKQHDISSLRLIFYGGGPMPLAVLERAMHNFRCSFTQGYGLTETLEATFLTAADHVLDGTPAQRKRLESAGREAIGAEIRIVDDAGQDLPSGEIGEILVRSKSVIDGYWRQPEAGAEVIRNGWFHTGDLGYLDDERYLFVVDRKKDMIVTGGVNVYTKEVETVLYQHPAVREAAVYGVPDDNWGERVTAAISLREGATVSAAELISFCREHLAGFKLPKHVMFLDELPKNPSGKILKRELRKLETP
jgi:acyl-CoA synthetase (AMP-forming)/AMP-acid ligase II